MRAVTKHRPAHSVQGIAGLVYGRRHCGVACGHPRHVSPSARAAGDEPSDDLLWHSPSHRSHRGRLAFCTCRLAQHLLVSDLRGCGALGRKLQAPARNIAGRASPAVQCAPSDAGVLAAGVKPSICAAGARKRRSFQWNVPVRTGSTCLSGRTPCTSPHAVLLVLSTDHFGHHGRRVAERASGRQDRSKTTDTARLCDHVHRSRLQSGS